MKRYPDEVPEKFRPIIVRLDCDRSDWLKLRGAIREELQRRNNTKGDTAEK